MNPTEGSLPERHGGRRPSQNDKPLADHNLAMAALDIAPLRWFNEQVLRFLPIGVVVIDRAYRIVTTYKRPKPAADLERIGREDLEVYRALAAHARARGALVLFVWHPDRAAVGGAEEVWKGRLAAMAADARVPLLDLLPAYRHAGGAALYVDGLHLGVAGHAVAGRAIGEWLAEAVLR